MSFRNGTSEVSTFSYASPGEVYAIGTVLPAMCVLVTAVRFITRKRQRVRIGIDDWLILGGLIALVGMGICFIVGAATHAMGYATPPPPPNLTTTEEILNYNGYESKVVGELEFAIQFLNVICYGFVKLSIIAFYRRLFVVNKKTVFDIVTKVMAVVIFLWTITFILIIIFPCESHVAVSWGSAADQDKYCLAIGYTSLEGLAGSDLILDLILLVLPIPLIWKLRMTTIKKIAVTGIMLLGAASLGASVARLVLYVQTQQAKISHVPIDFDQIITLDMYWSMLESSLALIAACLPTLSYFFHGFSLQSVISSVRSVLSLHSTRSDPKLGVTRSETGRPYIDLEANGSGISREAMFMKAKESGEIQEFAMESFTPAKPKLAKVGAGPTLRNELEA